MEKPKRAKSPEIKVWFGEQRYHIGGGSWGTEAVSWIGMKQRLEEFGGFGRGDLAWLKDDWGDRLASGLGLEEEGMEGMPMLQALTDSQVRLRVRSPLL